MILNQEDLQLPQRSDEKTRASFEGPQNDLRLSKPVPNKPQRIFLDNSNIPSLNQYTKKRTRVSSVWTHRDVYWSMQPKDFEALLEVMSLSSKSLTSFRMTFSRTGLIFRKVCSSLARSHVLKSLRLSFGHNWEFKRNDVTLIASLLAGLPSLSSLYLDFSFCYAICDKEFQSLCRGLTCQSKLSKL
mgnify:CR=1 FL=1